MLSFAFLGPCPCLVSRELAPLHVSPLPPRTTRLARHVLLMKQEKQLHWANAFKAFSCLRSALHLIGQSKSHGQVLSQGVAEEMPSEMGAHCREKWQREG